MADRCVMWLTYGQTGHVDGMTDGCVLSVTYRWSHVGGMTDGQLIQLTYRQTCLVGGMTDG